MNKVVFTKINWVNGLNRLYSAVWATNLTYWCLMAIGRSLREWVGMLFLAGILPWFAKKLIRWIYLGFTQ